MKAVFVVYNQAYNEEIIDMLESAGQRGFTGWSEISGRGSNGGKPHFGSHGWPEMNNAILTMVEDEKVEKFLSDLKAKDEEAPELGLRAIVWNVEMFY